MNELETLFHARFGSTQAAVTIEDLSHMRQQTSENAALFLQRRQRRRCKLVVLTRWIINKYAELG
jgi:hypothetical protein